MYSVECQCCNTIPVELWQAGTHVECGQCGAETAVPDSITLKKQSGDRYPFLSSLEKLRQLRDSAEPPFDGVCQACRQSEATWEILALLRILTERILDEHGGIRPSLTGGIKLVVSDGEEVWRVEQIPLLLCDSCHKALEADRRAAHRRKWQWRVFLLALSAGGVWYASTHDALPVAFVVLFAIVVAAVKVWTMRSTSSVDPYAIDWISKIDVAADVINNEEEFDLTFPEASPFDTSQVQ